MSSLNRLWTRRVRCVAASTRWPVARRSRPAGGGWCGWAGARRRSRPRPPARRSLRDQRPIARLDVMQPHLADLGVPSPSSVGRPGAPETDPAPSGAGWRVEDELTGPPLHELRQVGARTYGPSPRSIGGHDAGRNREPSVNTRRPEWPEQLLRRVGLHARLLRLSGPHENAYLTSPGERCCLPCASTLGHRARALTGTVLLKPGREHRGSRGSGERVGRRGGARWQAIDSRGALAIVEKAALPPSALARRPLR